jgi:hypothetical protein
MAQLGIDAVRDQFLACGVTENEFPNWTRVIVSSTNETRKVTSPAIRTGVQG